MKKRYLKHAWLLVGLLLFVGCSATENGVTKTQTLHDVIQGDHRSASNKARDQFRHPQDTLAFMGLQKDMAVVEIYPGGGWYTEIIAPYVKEQGAFYAAGFDPESDVAFFRKSAAAFKDQMAENSLFEKVNITVLAPPGKVDIAPAASADMVLTFRNVHNWMKAGYVDDVFSAMYAALKSGGVLGVVEHRGDSNTPQDPKAESGYVNQDYVIALAEKAGFTFVASSEINANPLDTKDHPKGVWTLPPTLRLGDVDKEKYLTMGESDRMTLKFVKP